MDITLTDSEILALDATKLSTLETTEAALHRFLLPLVVDKSETRLQKLADTYRQLSPEDQLTVIQTAKSLKR